MLSIADNASSFLRLHLIEYTERSTHLSNMCAQARELHTRFGVSKEKSPTPVGLEGINGSKRSGFYSSNRV